jgi:hypothetical protein
MRKSVWLVVQLLVLAVFTYVDWTQNSKFGLVLDVLLAFVVGIVSGIRLGYGAKER